MYKNNNNCLQIDSRLSSIGFHWFEYRVSIGNIVHEASIPTARGIHSFDAFVSANSDVIGALLNDYKRQYRYLSETLSRR